MLVSKIIATTCRGQGLFLGEKGTMQLRTVLISNIYSKTLRRTILKTQQRHFKKMRQHPLKKILTLLKRNLEKV